MSFLDVHLEQIQLCCEGISTLPFPPPRIFTNAILFTSNITSLIRDTESHERALFSVPPTKPPPGAPTTQSSEPPKKRRQTVFNVAEGEVTTGSVNYRAAPRRNTAVAAVLGGELHEQLRRGERGTASDRAGAKGGDVEVEVLLKGAEKLCAVYAVPGAMERVQEIRGRYTALGDTLAYYEERVAEQNEQLEAIKGEWMGEEEESVEKEEEEEGGAFTEEDLRRGEEEVRELDRRKRELQGRLREMERDLGGLRRMGDREW